jgi:L-threonylcarbamoyladenylate synthase
MTWIVKLDPLRPDKDVIYKVADILRSGGLCAFPTETVYGLGADGYNSDAVIKVFNVKRRPMDNPLIMHVDSVRMFEEVSEHVPETAYKLIKEVWPGPLTLIVRKSPKVPKEVTAGRSTVAVRCPGHPIALELISALGRPIAAPSANLAGRPSPTTAEHVIKDLVGLIEVIIDGGETFFGIESTIVDLTTDPPTLLRPGPITVEDLVKILGSDVRVPNFARGLSEAEVALSPGVKYRHYSPNTPLILIETRDYSDLSRLVNTVLNRASEEASKGLRVAIVCSSETMKYYLGRGYEVLCIGSRSNPYEVAHNLFSTLRLIDSLGVDIAIVEGFKEVGLGLAIMNRLRKAATYKVLID